MKKLMTLLIATVAASAVVAQTDTTKAATKGSNRLELGVNSKEGVYAEVKSAPDSVSGKPSPLVITTQRKKITIITEPREWPSQADSIRDLLKDLRTERRNTFTYWSGLDIGVNTLLGPDGDADLDADADFMQINNANSRFFSINFMEQKIEFGSHHVGLLTGLGLEFTNYRLANNVLLQNNADSVYALNVETPEFRKNKLRQTGLRIPLMLEFNTKRMPIPTAEEVIARANAKANGQHAPSFHPDNDHNFHIAMGVVGSWYFGTMYKQKYRLDGDDRKERDSGDYHLLPYRLAASVRMGYGSFNLFAEYALTPLFRENKGPELIPFNIGITLIGFN